MKKTKHFEKFQHFNITYPNVHMSYFVKTLHEKKVKFKIIKKYLKCAKKVDSPYQKMGP